MILYSKRNTVYKFFKIVIKKVNDKKAAQEELKTLRLLKSSGVFVPLAFFSLGRYIFMEFVKSETVVDRLEKANENEIKLIAQKLCGWLKSFYNSAYIGNKDTILSDVNCRNFLLTDKNEICGVDFETLQTGEKQSNLAEIVEFIYSCDFEQKKKEIFKAEFLTSVESEFGIDEKTIQPFFKTARERIEARRKEKGLNV